MGGRGASSGMSDKGKRYGTEYETLKSVSNIKFVRYKDSKSAKTPQETMAKGRIYVTVNNQDKLKSITYYDESGKRYKQIDLDHEHRIDGGYVKPHTHYGYKHNENGDKKLSKEEKRIVARILKIWYDKRSE